MAESAQNLGKDEAVVVVACTVPVSVDEVADLLQLQHTVVSASPDIMRFFSIYLTRRGLVLTSSGMQK